MIHGIDDSEDVCLPCIFINMAFAEVELLESSDVQVEELQLNRGKCEGDLGDLE